MIIEGQVGPRILADGSVTEIRLGRGSCLVSQDAHGRYQEAVYRGNVFFAASQAAITFSATITTTTAVGYILSNPPGSGKLVVPLFVEFLNTGVIAGSVALDVMPYSATAVTHTTALTVRNAYVSNGNAAVANADTGATLPVSPVVARLLFGVLSTNTAVINAAQIVDLGGSIILPPGTAMAMLSSAAVTGFVSSTWEELPYSV